MIRSIAALLSWNAGAQALLLLLAPVLPYLYAPDQFAPYAVFSALTMLLGQCVSLRLQDALRFETDKPPLVTAALALTLLSSLVLLPFSPLVAAGTAAISLYNIVFNVQSDARRYGSAGRLRLGRSIVLATGQLCLFPLHAGLAWAYIAGHALPAVMAVRTSAIMGLGWSPLSTALAVARRYLQFGIERTLSAAALFGAQLTPLLAAQYAYPVGFLAAFGFTDKLVGAIAALLTLSIETVAYQELAPQSIYRHRRFLALAYASGMLATLPFAALAFSGIIDGLLPPDWSDLPITLALALPTIPAIVMASFAIRMLTLLRHTRHALALAILTLIVRTLPFLIGVSATAALMLFAAFNILLGLLALAWMLVMARAVTPIGPTPPSR